MDLKRAAGVGGIALGVLALLWLAWRGCTGGERSRDAGISARVEQGAVVMQFPHSLDTQQAADVENWQVSARPSGEVLRVQAVNVGTDDRSVSLEIPGLQPGARLTIKYHLRTADGADLSGEIGSDDR